ncbi:2'-5' RNA ligase family protein [Bosea sp. PAMC 26642]|uniref:2'-5' RNA ligase family protein n=1 Tax=Bosea sp. (strain PAMC 26642) TaxID=1792307 RepID=UPI0009E8E3F9
MFGITLRTTSDAGPFWQWVARASAFEPSPSIRSLGYHPHITLTRYPDVSIDLLLSVARAFEGETPISLTFDRVSVFDTDPLVLWLSPRRSQRLLDLHARVHKIITPRLCDPHYRLREWVPHLTIALSVAIAQRSQSLELAAQPFEPFVMTFDAIDCVSWPPVRVLSTQRLW